MTIACLCALAAGKIALPQQLGHKGLGRTPCVLLYSKPIKIVRPTYPALARQGRIKGRVSMNCVIGADGAVEEIAVTQGHPFLIQAATEAVSQWRFKAPLLNGKGVRTTAKIDMDFQLTEES
jgi:TonB family protein